MFRVIKFFTDLQDKEHPYNVGDSFPREGMTVSEDRIKELSGYNNRQRTPLIEKIEEKKGAPDPAEERPAEPVEKPEAKEEPKPKRTRTKKK